MPFQFIHREQADQYLENVIVSSALTLIVIRVFLRLTGYPRLAPGNLHIAHAVWGGVILLCAGLLALTYRNQLVLSLSSVLTGVGWAFFVDEVGKFLTAEQDYFFRPAAPLIYLSFLVLWYLSIRVRRFEAPKAEIYHALDRLEEVMEASIDPADLQALKARLRRLSESPDDGLSDELARALLDFVQRREIRVREPVPSGWSMTFIQLRHRVDQLVLSARASRLWMPAALYTYAFVLGSNVFAHLLPLVAPDLAPALYAGLDVSPLSSVITTFFFVVLLALRTAVAALLIGSAHRIREGDLRGWHLAHRALLVSIAGADVLLFYFSQFSAAIVVVLDIVLLGWVKHFLYQRSVAGING